MKIAVCDDINDYISEIKEFSSEFCKINNIECEIDEYTSGSEFLNSDKSYDIIFLDVELGDSNGIDIAKSIREKSPNTVIFIITSYRKYLDEAMDIKVTRYIDKPITRERIFSVLEKAVDVISENILTLRTVDNHIMRIKINDIVYAEAKLKKVIVYTEKEKISAKSTLKSIRNSLNIKQFSTPHNSFIVNLNYVKEFKRDSIILTQPYENTRISIAPRRQAEFKRDFLDFIGENII